MSLVVHNRCLHLGLTSLFDAFLLTTWMAVKCHDGQEGLKPPLLPPPPPPVVMDAQEEEEEEHSSRRRTESEGLSLVLVSDGVAGGDGLTLSRAKVIQGLALSQQGVGHATVLTPEAMRPSLSPPGPSRQQVPSSPSDPPSHRSQQAMRLDHGPLPPPSSGMEVKSPSLPQHLLLLLSSFLWCRCPFIRVVVMQPPCWRRPRAPPCPLLMPSPPTGQDRRVEVAESLPPVAAAGSEEGYLIPCPHAHEPLLRYGKSH